MAHTFLFVLISVIINQRQCLHFPLERYVDDSVLAPIVYCGKN